MEFPDIASMQNGHQLVPIDCDEALGGLTTGDVFNVSLLHALDNRASGFQSDSEGGDRVFKWLCVADR